MKFTAVLFAAVAAIAGVNAAVESSEATSLHIRIHVHESHDKQGAICYKQCPPGHHCARGTTECREPTKNSSECFNPATSLWISKCDNGFKCSGGKCVYAQMASNYAGNPNGAICYKQCPPGQHCARGTTECREPTKHSSECFNPATSLWISKCDKGFKCSGGKCVYA